LLPHGGGAGPAGSFVGGLRGVGPHVAGASAARRAHRADRRVHDEPRASAGASALARRPGARRGAVVIKLDDYRRVAPPGVVDIVMKLAEQVQGRRLLHLSGGRFGSGVPEVLRALVPVMADLGVDAGWEVTGGDPGFYSTTHALRAALEGAERALT